MFRQKPVLATQKEWTCIDEVAFLTDLFVLGGISRQTSLFGEGTYLTSDLSMAVLYSPHGNGWRDSLLGPLLSCVAVCEVIDHPDVKCQVKRKGQSFVQNVYTTLFIYLGTLSLL